MLKLTSSLFISMSTAMILAQVDTYNLRSTQNGIYAAAGEQFIIQATANPTTGFKWHVYPDLQNECGVSGTITSSQTYEQNANPKNFMGVGGHASILFTVSNSAKPGSKCTLGLTYAQPWNMGGNDAEHPQKKITLHIK